MPKQELVNLDWPRKGFVENAALMEQPEGTTTDCLNVRNYDALDRRNRGGQRTGLQKYIADAVNSTNPIQKMGAVVLAFDSSSLLADQILITQDFSTFANGTLTTINPDWVAYDQLFDNLDVADTPEIVSGELVGDSAGALSQSVHYAPSSPLVPGSKYVINWRGRTNANGFSPLQIAFRMHPTDPITNNTFLMVHIQILGGDLTARLFNQDGSNQTLDSGSSNIDSLAIGGQSATQIYGLQVNGNFFRLLVNGVEAWTATNTTAAAQSAFGITVGQNVSLFSSVRFWQVATGLTPVSLRTTELIAVSGGTIKNGSRADGLSTPTGGSTVLATVGRVDLQAAFQKVYFCDGLEGGYKILDPKLDVVSDWQTAVTSGALPTGGTGSANNITATDSTANTVTVSEDLSSLSANDFIEIRNDTGDPTNNGSYTVASTSGTGPTTITVNESIQNDSGTGDLLVSDVGCRIMALYRGRVVLAGLETDPQNWFMSASGDPLNWNYFPATSSATQAVAGNNNKAGLLGDVVTALAPYLDDVLIIGGANTIWVMKGDPASGGEIDNVSRKIGIVGPEAWTFDTGQRFYFFGVNGLYRMDLNTFEPVLLSQNRLDKTFASVNTASKQVILIYDPEWQGVHVFISSDGQPSTADRHFFWDERNDAFWPDEYPVAHGPASVFQFSADNPEDNAVLCGGYDSFIRSFDEDALDDDGTVIPSRCRFTPINPGLDVATSRIEDVTIITDQQSGTVTYKHFAGDTVEDAELNADNDTPRVSRTMVAGRNTPLRQRVSQNAHILELSQAGNNSVGATWAYEGGACKAAILDRIHGRRV